MLEDKMTKWTLKKNPGRSSIAIFKTEEGQPEILLGRMNDLHNGLIDISNFLKPGDVVITPEGPNIVQAASGELNN